MNEWTDSILLKIFIISACIYYCWIYYYYKKKYIVIEQISIISTLHVLLYLNVY